MAADWLATDLYAKLLPSELGPYYRLSTTREPVTIDEKGIPNTKSSNQALDALQLDRGASATSSSIEGQAEHAQGTSGEHSPTDPLGKTGTVQPQTATCITETTKEAEQIAGSYHGERDEKIMKVDNEYKLGHTVRHVGKTQIGGIW